MIKPIHISKDLKWYYKTPLFYTSMFGYRCFFTSRIKNKYLLYKWKWIDWKRTLDWKLDKLIHSRKCKTCGHPFWFHQCYEHGTCVHGVCLNSTFAWEINDCECEHYQ